LPRALAEGVDVDRLASHEELAPPQSACLRLQVDAAFGRSVSGSLTGWLTKCLPLAVCVGWLSNEVLPVRVLAAGGSKEERAPTI
jgi:hypothetical protein